ncbi:MAG: GTP cyclohydrolase II [Alphaproteobacteria bacterium]|nr:GTP cyclohydrolase II [Alphaproteobacteria bacterium]
MLKPHANQNVADGAVLQAVARALADLRRGAPVLLHAPGEAALVLAAEQVSDPGLAHLSALAGGAPMLLLTGRRAAALGLVPNQPSAPAMALHLDGIPAATIVELADPAIGDPNTAKVDLPVGDATKLATAAIDLNKLARLLPAAVVTPISPAPVDPVVWAAAHDILALGITDIEEYRFAGARSLTRVAEARLPLAQAENTRIIAFRPGDGGIEHLALVIGEPPSEAPVLVRLHSECFTGDLLGSLRCDCGDQLHGAIEAIAKAGSGVLLYLAQEGRGIGLVNKLRAYGLQDRGADTAEANEQLGFDADERIYLPAAEMLRQLGYRRVRLLTNNPHKVTALAHCGISVDERVPHAFPSNGHNAFYLATKAARFGHEF